jgi:hypothetical protein
VPPTKKLRSSAGRAAHTGRATGASPLAIMLPAARPRSFVKVVLPATSSSSSAGEPLVVGDFYGGDGDRDLELIAFSSGVPLLSL